MPKFSIVLPTYNRAFYLNEALASVFAQTYTDYELIVIDDGSTDKTPEVIRQYGPRLRFFHQKNQGRSAARNFGIRQAHGELIAFLDSDDHWLPDKLQRQAAFFEHHPGISFLYGHVNMISDNGSFLDALTAETQALWARSHEKGETYENWALQCCCFLSSVVIRKTHLDKVGEFDSLMEPNEDLDLYLRIAREGKIGFLEGKPLTDYRVHPGNSGNERLARSAVQVATKHLERLTSVHPSQEGQNRLVRNFYLLMSRSHFVLQETSKGRECFMKALRQDLFTLLLWPYVRLYLTSHIPTPLKKRVKQLRRGYFTTNFKCHSKPMSAGEKSDRGPEMANLR